MGINPIQYRPWKGERTAQNLRVYVILRTVFKHLVRSTWTKVLLIIGFLLLFAFQLIAVALSPHEELTAEEMVANINGYGLALFAMLLAAIVTSDLISEDVAGNSLVLYFSRAVRIRDYVIGKTGGALLVMGLLCFIPPVLIAIVSIITQSGGDYLSSLGVLARTVAAGILATVFYVPYGMMMSSLTKRRSYAAVGTFMSFFVLTIIVGFFVAIDESWIVISPIESLVSSFDWIFGQPLSSGVNEGALLAFLACFIIVPMMVVCTRLLWKVVGK